MSDYERTDASQSRHTQELILCRLIGRGPQTVRDLINSGLTDNPDDAVAVMSRIEESGKGRWIEIDGIKALVSRD